MKGMDAIRIEFRRKGAPAFEVAGVLTSLPSDVSIKPQVEGDPETGHVRAIYLKKNAPDGDYSPEYPVTLSQQIKAGPTTCFHAAKHGVIKWS